MSVWACFFLSFSCSAFSTNKWQSALSFFTLDSLASSLSSQSYFDFLLIWCWPSLPVKEGSGAGSLSSLYIFLLFAFCFVFFSFSFF